MTMDSDDFDAAAVAQKFIDEFHNKLKGVDSTTYMTIAAGLTSIAVLLFMHEHDGTSFEEVRDSFLRQVRFLAEQVRDDVEAEMAGRTRVQ